MKHEIEIAFILHLYLIPVKKIIALSFLILIWPACGRLCPDQPPYIHVNDVQVIGFNGYDIILIPTEIEEDEEFRITAQFDDVKYVTDNFQWNFGNPAYALSCVDPGSGGLKADVDSIWITSDKEFRSWPAGTSLNSYFQPLHEVYNDDSLRYILEPVGYDVQIQEANKSYNTVKDMFWIPKSHEESPDFQQFEIHIRFADGREINGSTNPVKFVE